MEKRVFVTIAISIVIIVGWFYLFPVKPPQTPAPAPATSSAPAAPAVVTPPGTPTPTPPATTGAPGAMVKPPEQRVTLLRPGLYRAVFSSWGAAPQEFTLLNPQYKEKRWIPKPEYLAKLPVGAAPVRISDDDPNWEQRLVPINMVRPEAGQLPFVISFLESDISLAPDAAWTLESQTDEDLVYATDVGDVHLEKRWHVPPTGYRLDLTISLTNRGEKPVAEHLELAVDGWQDPSSKPGGLLSFGRRTNLTDGDCYVGGKLHHKNLEELLHPSSSAFGCGPSTPGPLGINEVGDVKWIGTGEQFFLMAAALDPGPGGDRRCRVQGDPLGRIVADAIYAERRLAKGEKTDYKVVAFIGPKLLHELDAVNVGGQDAKLGDAVNYTLEWVARPMLWVLQQIQRVVINWGVAIIIITILLKLVTYYPTYRGMRTMRQVQRVNAQIKPQMDAIRAKFPDDKARQNQEMMKLYQQHGLSPMAQLGGCLPTLLQMPIYIAFYSMLSLAVQLYRASFVGPIDDMTAPFWPLAVVTGGLMFLQQRLTPQPTTDGQQQKMLMYMMPVMFMAFTRFLPSGLTLYILTNTVLTMVQQWYFNRSHPLPAPTTTTPKKTKPARA